jgi:hypothetical protein
MGLIRRRVFNQNTSAQDRCKGRQELDISLEMHVVHVAVSREMEPVNWVNATGEDWETGSEPGSEDMDLDENNTSWLDYHKHNVHTKIIVYNLQLTELSL